MKIYKIKVNGKEYEVEVEVLDKHENKTENFGNSKNTKEKIMTSIGNQEIVRAPIQGNIISINLKEGDRVSKGDILVIIEAMKMENEIIAPISGIIKKICVTQGRTVNNGEELLIIEEMK